jgi:predicted HAD superfamily Cof-like phosphohydrolase
MYPMMALENAQYMVAQFMEEVCLKHVPSTPSVPDYETVRLCISLMQEELNETIEALWKSTNAPHAISNQRLAHAGALTNIADGLADLIYVALYTANATGINLDPIFKEVQRSNMTKIGGGFNAKGKLIKPDSYEPANLLPIIDSQMTQQPEPQQQPQT